jgi:hypothetical protein
VKARALRRFDFVRPGGIQQFPSLPLSSEWFELTILLRCAALPAAPKIFHSELGARKPNARDDRYEEKIVNVHFYPLRFATLVNSETTLEISPYARSPGRRLSIRFGSPILS